MTTYFHSHEFCCSPKKPGSSKGKSGKGKAKSGKSHSKQNQSLLQIPNHQMQPSLARSPKRLPNSGKHSCHSQKQLLPSPSPSYYHIAPPPSSHHLVSPSTTCQLVQQSPNNLLQSPSHLQLHLSPSHHQFHLSPSHHQLHLSASHHQLQHPAQNHQKCCPPASPSHLFTSPSSNQIYKQHQCHSSSHHLLFQQCQQQQNCPPPLPHASQSLSIHPFNSPQPPLCSRLGGYRWSTLPTSLVTRTARGKFPNLRDSVKKSPTKSKGKFGCQLWPNDTYIWSAHSAASHPRVPIGHHCVPIHTHVQANPPPVVVNTDSVDTPPY
ncbi:hypothetical protein AMECASPLE_026280, partial [Ameca splendens]